MEGFFFARIKFFAKAVGGNKVHARKNFLRSTVDVCAGIYIYIYTYELRIILYDGTRPSERVIIFDTRSVAFLFFFYTCKHKTFRWTRKCVVNTFAVIIITFFFYSRSRVLTVNRAYDSNYSTVKFFFAQTFCETDIYIYMYRKWN